MTHQLTETSERLFPRNGCTRAKLEFLVRYAVLAPSAHNSQPWLFRVRGDTLQLFADRTRALAIADPHDRELTISCGAALEHARIAARVFGYEGVVELLPDPLQPDLLAGLRLGGTHIANAIELRMFDAMPHRRTTRLAFSERVPPQKQLDDMGYLAGQHGVELRLIVDQQQRQAIARLVAEADQRQMADRAFRHELAAWIRPASAVSHDGMSIESAGGPDVLSPAAALVIRTFDVGGGAGARDQDLANGSPVLGVLATDEDDVEQWLRTGMALSDILLEATARDIRSAYLNQPVEVPALRSQLQSTAGTTGIPQLLLRFGYAPQVPPAARRDVLEVLGS